MVAIAALHVDLAGVVAAVVGALPHALAIDQELSGLYEPSTERGEGSRGERTAPLSVGSSPRVMCQTAIGISGDEVGEAHRGPRWARED